MWKKVLAEDSSIRSQISEEFGGLSQDAIIGVVEEAKAHGQIK